VLKLYGSGNAPVHKKVDHSINLTSPARSNAITCSRCTSTELSERSGVSGEAQYRDRGDISMHQGLRGLARIRDGHAAAQAGYVLICTCIHYAVWISAVGNMTVRFLFRWLYCTWCGVSGIMDGKDMVTEACVTKLSYLMGR